MATLVEKCDRILNGSAVVRNELNVHEEICFVKDMKASRIIDHFPF